MPAVSNDFAAQLRTQGYRLTPQRLLILDAIRRAKDHVTPEQIYQTVHQQNSAISRTTIYRTLDFLCEMRLVTAMRWGGQTYYEIVGETPHHHLVCRACGALEALDPALLDALIAAIEKKHRFTVDMNHVALFGLCGPCRAEAKKARRR